MRTKFRYPALAAAAMFGATLLLPIMAPAFADGVPPGAGAPTPQPAASLVPPGSAGAAMGGAKNQTSDSVAGAGVAAAEPARNEFIPNFGVLGMDVSGWQATVGSDGKRIDNVDWQAEWKRGVRFSYVKATEGNYFISDTFKSQAASSKKTGMLTGAYHFAIPSRSPSLVSDATAQANYFIANGGAWKPDGKTLPPMLDIEYNPYPSLGDACFNMAGAPMISWIKTFSTAVAAKTGRLPVIYTTTDWWTKCTGNSPLFGNQPLFIARWNNTDPGVLPAGWSRYSIWQYSSTGPTAGDSDVWNGDLNSLRRFALWGAR